MRKIGLSAAAPKAATGTVKAVEDLLERVKSGEVREVAWAARLTGTEVETGHVGETDDIFRMLGAVRYLEQRIVDGVQR